ncbi:phage portal protein [Lactiplantibacillus plantarum]|uniref:phage portal protein n=1 Tax=Lactiplantibacillus plantarum TaxID=1590 RepID=UPI003132FB14
MSILDPFNLTTRTKYIPSQSYSPSFASIGGKLVPQGFINADKGLKNVDIFAMINLISSDIASCNFQNGGIYEELLKQPSNLINGYSFWQSSVIQLLLTGNSYLLIHSHNGVAQWLEQVPTSCVTIQLADDNSNVQYEINFGDKRGTVLADNSEMIHVKLMPTGEVTNDDLFVGTSPLQSLTDSIAVTDNANRLTLSTIANAINPSAVISVPDAQLTAEAKDAIRDKFVAANSGSNAGKVMVVDQSASVSTIQINSDVAKFLNSIDWGADRVAEAFGVPSSYLNRDTADAQSNSQQIMSFYASSLNRYINPLISELAFKLHLPDLKLNIRDSTDVDGSQTIAMVTSLASGKTPVLTPSQAQSILVRKGLINQDDINSNQEQQPN